MNDDYYPGDIIRAQHCLRAWEDENTRGSKGDWLNEGDLILVIEVWTVGKSRRRIRGLVGMKVMVFSCNVHDVYNNWSIVARSYSNMGP